MAQLAFELQRGSETQDRGENVSDSQDATASGGDAQRGRAAAGARQAVAYTEMLSADDKGSRPSSLRGCEWISCLTGREWIARGSDRLAQYRSQTEPHFQEN